MDAGSIQNRVRGFLPRSQLLALLLSDALALQCSALLAFAAREFFIGPLDGSPYLTIMPILLLGPVFSAAFGACQTIALPPHKEVRQLFMATSLTYLVVLATLFLTKEGETYSRMVILSAWMCSIVALPLLRGLLRRRLCRASWWCRPLVFLQRGPLTEELWESLARHPQRGLRPVAALDCAGADIHTSATMMDMAVREHPDAVALVFLDAPNTNTGADMGNTTTLIRAAAQRFARLLLVPSITTGEHPFWLSPREMEGAVGLLVRQNLLDVRRLRAKRAIDIILTVGAACVALPLGILLALCIRMDSKGPVFYTHERIGQHGRPFRVYKFRTMVANADDLLQTCFAHKPHLHEEWKENQKMRDDPRITCVGVFLRKTSLDELPQLINVLLGNMSLVGPRPIVADEVIKYGQVYTHYCMVKPGITGLWQVSGRNNTTYSVRVRMDYYYVNNWSVWMDLWILARTIPVVILGKGAY